MLPRALFHVHAMFFLWKALAAEVFKTVYEKMEVGSMQASESIAQIDFQSLINRSICIDYYLYLIDIDR